MLLQNGIRGLNMVINIFGDYYIQADNYCFMLATDKGPRKWPNGTISNYYDKIKFCRSLSELNTSFKKIVQADVPEFDEIAAIDDEINKMCRNNDFNECIDIDGEWTITDCGLCKSLSHNGKTVAYGRSNHLIYEYVCKIIRNSNCDNLGDLLVELNKVKELVSSLFQKSLV